MSLLPRIVPEREDPVTLATSQCFRDLQLIPVSILPEVPEGFTQCLLGQCFLGLKQGAVRVVHYF